MEGARRFRWPRNLGLGPYEGCHIIVLKNNLGKASAEWTRALKAKATEEIRIGRHSAYLFQQTNHKDEWHIYLVQARPNVLLCATDRTYLQQVLERSEHPTGPRALPADLPEWKHINPHIRYWAVRHYAKDAKQKAFASGCAFAFDPDCDKVARVNYVGVPLGALGALVNEWNQSRHLKVQANRTAAGVVELSANLAQQPTAPEMFFLILLLQLGHVICI
jgi:hypothetical protein